MSYLEELLPEFRKGAKIRMKNWPKPFYYELKNGKVYNQDGYIVKELSQHVLFQREWEFYQEPVDWQYIIDHKCLCWFWNGDDRNKGVIDYLVTVSNESYELYENTSGCRWSHCRPVRRDEVIFYEDKKDD